MEEARISESILYSTRRLPRILSLAHFHKSNRVDFLIDRYPKISTKNAERQKRASAGIQSINIFGKHQKVPAQWKKFMSLGRSKYTEESLPPNFDSLHQHIIRANYEVFVRIHYLQPMLALLMVTVGRYQLTRVS